MGYVEPGMLITLDMVDETSVQTFLQKSEQGGFGFGCLIKLKSGQEVWIDGTGHVIAT